MIFYQTIPLIGFNKKVVQKTTKSLSCISMKASFYIWLARHSAGWSSETSLITIEDKLLVAKTIPTESAEVLAKLFWAHNQPEI